MLTSEEVRRFATEELGVDKLGIASIERFDEAPPDMHPRHILPRTRSVIVYLRRILRGAYRGIDQGTHWASYTQFCYQGLNARLGRDGYRLGRFLERHGHEATPVAAAATSREVGPRGPEPGPDRPWGQVTMHFRLAACAAGLGELGWSKVLLTPELGPRQRLGLVLTDAELEPDPLFTGQLCDRCMRCVRECPAGAIPRDRSVGVEIEGRRFEWGDLNLGQCKLTHFGLNRRNGQFLVKRYPGLYLPLQEQNVTWLEAWNLGLSLFSGVRYYDALAGGAARVPIALCGARGCIIGCMKHLEARGRVENTFPAQPGFSREEPWSLPERPPAVEHRGLVYDPDRATEPESDEALSLRPGMAWY